MSMRTNTLKGTTLQCATRRDTHFREVVNKQHTVFTEEQQRERVRRELPGGRDKVAEQPQQRVRVVRRVATATQPLQQQLRHLVASLRARVVAQ